MSSNHTSNISNSLSVHEKQLQQHTSQKLKTYVSGYVLSVLLTLVAYLIVVHQMATNYWFVVIVITVLAFLQFIVQLVYFLHINTGKQQRWKLIVLIFMIIVVAILVLGSVWIMNNLNYRMTPQQVNTYMQNQDNL